MKKEFIKITFFVFLFFGSLLLQAQNVYIDSITKDEAQQYLTKLYSDMQMLHPNLYQYISKEEYDKAYHQLMQSLDTAAYYYPSKLYRAFVKFEALCRDSHSGVGLFLRYKKPDKNSVAPPIVQDSTVKVFPFMFHIVKGKMYACNHCFGNDSIPEKSEIISIGNQTTQEWLQQKRADISGERDDYRDANINRNANSMYLYTDSCKFGYIPFASHDTLYKTLHCSIHVLKYDRFLSIYV